MLRRKPEVFAPTDGVLYVATDAYERAERGADFSDPLLLDTVFPLAFRRMRMSARDVEMADAMGCELSVKVEVRSVATLDTQTDVVFGGKVYELSRVDNRGRTCWLWLSEIACDGTCELVSETYEQDAVGIPRRTGLSSREVYVRSVSPSLRHVASGGADALGPAMSLRLRTLDYLGEQRLNRGGRSYTVTGAETHGRWMDLTCRERGSDRGQD